jgi:hypothetical protein
VPGITQDPDAIPEPEAVVWRHGAPKFCRVFARVASPRGGWLDWHSTGCGGR